MCGSSARKLRHGAANLLGGRALYRTLHPLTTNELGVHFKLELVLAYGSLPKIYTKLMEKQYEETQDLLRAYVITYLKEEIKSEALVRNLQGFQNFLEVAAAQFGEQINFSALSRDCQVALSTAKEYYFILEDTLIGFFLPPHIGSIRKRMSQQPKFYFFDNGVTRALLGNLKDPPTPYEKCRLFEQWFIQEVARLNDYFQNDWKLSFWRTAHGAEVDLLISRGKKILCAIECKSTPHPATADLSGLRAFHESYPNVPVYLVAPVKKALRLDRVSVLPPLKILEILTASK
jgi:predicted AAA+ superfamily ATPase